MPIAFFVSRILNLTTLFLFINLLTPCSAVAEATSINKKWEIVGQTVYGKRVLDHSLAIDKKGSHYVAYSDLNTIYVKRFDGKQWNQIGSSFGSFASHVSSGSLAFDTHDTPWVIYDDGSPAIAVMKLIEGQWTQIGDILSNETGFGEGLAIDSNDTPYVVFQNSDKDFQFILVTVKKFDGMKWVPVGKEKFLEVWGLFAKSLVVDTLHTPYLGYVDKNHQLKVIKFDGQQWVAIGKGLPESWVQTGECNLVIDTKNTLYISFIDTTHGSKPTVMKFDGEQWVIVGEPGFTDAKPGCVGYASCGSLALDANGMPYFAYNDFIAGYRTSVMKFNGSEWKIVGAPGFTDSGAVYEKLFIDPSTQQPCVAYVFDNQNGMVSCYNSF